MANPYQQWKQLLTEPRLIAMVIIVNGDGTVIATTPGGGTVRLFGTATVGKRVLYQGDVVLSEMPELPAYDIAI
jgi:hypothetical protein